MLSRLIKGRKNDFGQRSYKVESDKSALSSHINKIIK